MAISQLSWLLDFTKGSYLNLESNSNLDIKENIVRTIRNTSNSVYQ